eukprot:TRINITY_DN3530_c1_g1_i2.p1 TRINITY_DN3530_c1_g1~~TRINITY_DN3530_c1_g1_i2.p1  ORF type:complete len:310 (-),score=59.50 TRINITY_DN3530_c1_g1_i2:869-1798(-)
MEASQPLFLMHSTTHPKFLESNSTSHSWVFGAFAELFDNSLDAGAVELTIDILNEPLVKLVVQDNGCGMDGESLHSMMSFGHCFKEGQIGRYGNGFKSGSMRIGKDALVFTKNGSSFSVGMLSRTFLEATGANEVLIPMISWDASTREIQQISQFIDANVIDNSLQMIYSYSPFHSLEEVMSEFDEIPQTGTRIIIYNLNMLPGEVRQFELDFSSNPKDILLRSDAAGDYSDFGGARVSLREYCKILYLVPKMKINLRGVHVRTVILSKTLYMTKSVSYKPKDHNELWITFGRDKGQAYPRWKLPNLCS